MLLKNHGEAIGEETMTSDGSGMTILHYIAWSSKSRREHIYSYLRDSDASVLISRNFLGRSLMHLAAQRGNVSVLEYLLELSKGAGTETRDATGQTVLHYAVYSRRTETIDLLLAYGADAHAVDSKGRTLLHCAVERKNLPAARRVVETCKNILDLPDNDGATAAELAYAKGLYEMAAYLNGHSLGQPGSGGIAVVSATRASKGGNTDTNYLGWELIVLCFLLVFTGASIWYLAYIWDVVVFRKSFSAIGQSEIT